MAKILIIEDEPNLQLLYKSEIESMGHEAICLSGGREAYQYVEHQQPDVIVLDIMMPHGDGKEFLTRLLDSRISIPVIINSAYSHYKNDFICWAAEAYVIKSSDLGELKEEIARILERKHLVEA
ncbi:response regulator [bacterium]|nr:response regulator [bacterium]